MMYLAVEVCPEGGTIRDADTLEPRTVVIGEHDNKGDAVENACQMLDCRQLFRGVIRCLKGNGGYIVLNVQDYAEV